MERRITSLASPLSALRTLEHNLGRERRVFAMLLVLLAFAGLCAAAVAALSIGAASLSNQATQMRVVKAQTNQLLLRRFNLLSSLRLLLALHEDGALGAVHMATPTPPQACTPAFDDLTGAADLRAFCDRVAQMASVIGPDEPMMFVLLDGSAAWSHQLKPNPRGSTIASLQGGADHARMLVDAVLLRMNTRGIDPLGEGRWRQVTWFHPAAGLGFAPPVVLGAVTVLKDGKPYAIVLTAIDLDQLPGVPDLGTADASPTLFDRDGAMLAGPLPVAGAQYVDRAVANLSPERFHLVPRFGWVMREQPLEYDFGHYTLAISWTTQFALIRMPLAIIALMTLALLVLLGAIARYWNHHVLERTYAEATHALEGELLNHLLVHATPVGLCIVRRRNFEIVIANQIVRNVLGLDAQATRLPAALCVEFEKRTPYAPPRDGELPIYDLPFSLTREDGENVHLEITFAPATMRREDVMFCAFADMSKHYEAERLLREAKRTSDEAARSKVSFFAAMSHEIRTPLASLTGNIELVARGPLAPEQEARVQAMQVSSSELLQIVSDVLDFSKIDVGAMTLSEESESIAAQLVRIALAHAPLAARQQLPFYLVMDRAIPARLYFDPVRVAQIVNNLLSNAFKFTHSGKIVLRANWRDDTLEISVADSGMGMPESLKARLFQPFTQGDAHRLTEARGTGLGLSICGRLAKLMHGRCEVESTLGVGTRVIVSLPLRPDGDASAGSEWTLPDVHPAILCRAPENHEWLTNLFDKTVSMPIDLASLHDSSRESSLDYLLVTDEYTTEDVQRLWGGTANVVWVRQDGPLVPLAREDGSVEVSLYSLTGIRTATQMLRAQPCMPLDGTAQAVPSSTPQPPQGSEFQRLNVLIAEDNLLNRSLLRDQLRTLGANVIEAKDGEEALARLEEAHVDVVLTDLNMPRMNGLELLKVARAKHAALPIYAVSGNALPEQIAQGRQSGFTDYLSKPVPLAALARVLADIAAQAHPIAPPTQDADEDAGEDVEVPRFPALSPEIALLFIEQADHDIADYARIVPERDFKRLREWAHRVSGGLAVLGPSMLYEACLELRATLRESGAWTDEAQALSNAVVQELEALREQAASQHSA
ncbi:two-component system capsular synthesis sensor histidine kinase RcsC [Paraburkholderia eburnea]|uniref:histidine kinase n=1 Tax=Paraburkholderia eburnea TaxID=1189126 RepID=A0A2S4MJT5_9BURK|nr:hybrid sensor histidine kinase/response regulator [Paraburkholderia eburnea]POR55044.1 two-component system capsular synthesis sensor histidine kinase RcsC [Paraburkholderia eburnea]PRZ24357.1 two-component system capsular synthesis sensor histidine kinase RcsC [Paraburkholderia eburnea]